MRSFHRVLLVAALAATTAIPSAHAAPDGWTLVSTSTAPAPAAVGGGLDAIVRAARQVSGAKTECVPRRMDSTAFQLVNQTWVSTNGQIAYQWYGSGQGWSVTGCASKVHVDVLVTDYAPAGQPPVERSAVATGDSATATTMPDGSKRYVANATAESWVVYYNGLYQRGSSLVEVKVTGTYFNPQANAWRSIGCVKLFTPVTPTPTGPIYGDTYQEKPCGG